ncbi:hypothetical protein JVX98_10250 [Ensifer sp. PDNC004]|uniref:hypothetical protein n=1 Tax=Ensifer sp. PDNC004 TaxID=2811423 RepID=UPI0019646DEE|nr:hypothetical protein [Ensifer sp. PDNC004]QRY70346.1 hypothetical protein JVX98_10250 [Ensifer sp. PDNC004]
MRITAIVEALVQSGASPEMILSAVRAAEAGHVSEIERRRAGDRERQQRRRARVTSRDVTVTANGTLSDKESSPVPPKETNSPDPNPGGAAAVPDAAGSRPKGSGRATRLPEDFEPDWGFAAGLGFGRAEAGVEFDKFRDYWRAKSGRDATKLDWAAAWRNWMRNAGGRGLRGGGQTRRGHHPQAPPQETAFARHQRECRQTIENQLNGNETNDLFRNDDFAGGGPAFDLGPGDYRAH